MGIEFVVKGFRVQGFGEGLGLWVRVQGLGFSVSRFGVLGFQ